MSLSPLHAVRVPQARCERLYPLAICLLGAVLYGGAVRNGFTTWDDDLYVTRNPLIRDASLEGIARIFTTTSICNYHPLALLTFLAEHAAAGLDPRLYHLDNVILHVAASLFAFQLARRWLGSAAAAFAAAVLFLAHPLRVESVAWVAERKDVLCAVFYLASLLAYTRHLDGPGAEGRGRAAYAASLSLFLLALLSKVMAVTLPAALALLLVSRRSLTRRRLLGIAPFAGLSILFAWIGVEAQAAEGAVQGLHGGEPLRHILTPLKALAFYAGKLAFPVQLSPRYVLEPAAGLFDPGVLAGSVLAAVAAALAAASFLRRRVAFLGISFFAVAWAPVSGLVPTSTIVADRYLYLPAFGLFLVAGTLWGATGRLGRILNAPFWVLAALCILLTPGRVAVWREPESLWTDALRENPRNPFAFNQLSVAYLDAGRHAEALSAAAEAARFGLRRPEHLFNLCLAFRGLADREGEREAARRILEESPGFIPARMVLLRQLIEDGRLSECESVLEGLLGEHPGDAGLHGLRGALEEARGDVAAALGSYLRSVELRAGDPEVLLGAAAMLARLGDLDRAVATAEATVSLGGGDLPPGARDRLEQILRAVAERGDVGLLERAKRLEERPRRR